MPRVHLRPLVFYTVATLLSYGIIFGLLHRTGAFLKIAKLHYVLVLTLLELGKLVYIKRTYGLTGVSVALPRPQPGSVSVFKESVKFAGLHLFCIFVYSFVCCILGAPFLSDHYITLVLASTLNTLTMLPVSILLGVRGTLVFIVTDQLKLSKMTDNAFFKFLEAGAGGTLLGAWAASVAYPLDWDRDWQAYPYPNIAGALLGHLAGCFYGLTREKFSRVKPNKLL